MTDKPLHFVSGLPRSGTTLLMNLLGQNPAHYVTPTSGLIHLMRHQIRAWPQYKEFQSQGLENARPFVLSALRGLLYGFYERQFDAGQTVFDKSRGWIQYVEPLEEILGRPVKIVTMVRDVRAIVASFEKLFRRRGIEFRYVAGDDAAESLTVEARARHTLRADQVTGRSALRLRDALARCRDRLLIVPYERFTAEPLEALAAIHEFLGLPAFDYDPQHVEQITHEDDCVNGADLHRIRPQVEPAPAEPWKQFLPEGLCREIDVEYTDINELAAGPVAATANP
jgi:sulfotransferase